MGHPACCWLVGEYWGMKFLSQGWMNMARVWKTPVFEDDEEVAQNNWASC